MISAFFLDGFAKEEACYRKTRGAEPPCKAEINVAACLRILEIHCYHHRHIHKLNGIHQNENDKNRHFFGIHKY